MNAPTPETIDLSMPVDPDELDHRIGQLRCAFSTRNEVSALLYEKADAARNKARHLVDDMPSRWFRALYDTNGVEGCERFRRALDEVNAAVGEYEAAATAEAEARSEARSVEDELRRHEAQANEIARLRSDKEAREAEEAEKRRQRVAARAAAEAEAERLANRSEEEIAAEDALANAKGLAT